jgi:tight adherence protein B
LLVATVYFIFSRPGRRNLRRRLSQFISPPLDEDATTENAPGLIVAPRLGRSWQRSLERMRWWPAFEEELDVARIERRPAELVALSVVSSITLTLFLGVVSGSALFALLGLLVLPGVRSFVKFKLQRERRHFADQLADNLTVISSALRAGHSLVGAMAVAVADAPQPTKREFERVVNDEKLGVSLEEGLTVVARRMNNRDLEQVVLVASLQRETGGNTAEVLDRVADTVRERAELRRLIKTLTAQGRISRWVVTALPIMLGLVISVLNPSYLNPLFQTGAGHAMLVVAAVLLVSGSLVIKKVVDIEV